MKNKCAFHTAFVVHNLKGLEHGLRKRREQKYLEEKLNKSEYHLREMFNICEDYNDESVIGPLLKRFEILKLCVLNIPIIINERNSMKDCIKYIPFFEFYSTLEV